MRIMILAVLSILGGCTTATTMHAPDGKEMQAIECHGAAQGPAACYKKAGEICGAKGYDILGREGDKIPTSSGYAYANQHHGMYVQEDGMTVHRTLYIRCKEAA